MNKGDDNQDNEPDAHETPATKESREGNEKQESSTPQKNQDDNNKAADAEENQGSDKPHQTQNRDEAKTECSGTNCEWKDRKSDQNDEKPPADNDQYSNTEYNRYSNTNPNGDWKGNQSPPTKDYDAPRPFVSLKGLMNIFSADPELLREVRKLKPQQIEQISAQIDDKSTTNEINQVLLQVLDGKAMKDIIDCKVSRLAQQTTGPRRIIIAAICYANAVGIHGQTKEKILSLYQSSDPTQISDLALGHVTSYIKDVHALSDSCRDNPIACSTAGVFADTFQTMYHVTMCAWHLNDCINHIGMQFG